MEILFEITRALSRAAAMAAIDVFFCLLFALRASGPLVIYLMISLLRGLARANGPAVGMAAIMIVLMLRTFARHWASRRMMLVPRLLVLGRAIQKLRLQAGHLYMLLALFSGAHNCGLPPEVEFFLEVGKSIVYVALALIHWRRTK